MLSIRRKEAGRLINTPIIRHSWVVIGDGVRLQRCVLLENAKVKEHAWIKSTIVGWNSVVGRWARLENITILGDDVTIGDEVYVNGGTVLPHKSIKQNVDVPSIIM
ncbi:mannose-1-phosphate guanyltransferase [Ascosphaera atra]|nr:mannose-1-phosphate guanyltransferase [Ascosphaera atra]